MRSTCVMVLVAAVLFAACNNANTSKQITISDIGNIEQYDSALSAIIKSDAAIEIIGEGFEWSEGPVWVSEKNMLLFSDVPRDTVYKWTEEKGVEVYLSPSGYTGQLPRKGERGSNGLLLDAQGRLVLCQHGNRQLARMDSPLDSPAPKYISLASAYNGKPFNSPNDAVFASNGDLYFTDPPYGLPTGGDDDPEKAIPFNGVYKLSADGSVRLLVDSITRPNGIGLFPGGQQMIIANSDPAKPVWYVYDIKGDSLTNGKIFYDAAGTKAQNGLPDGLKVDSKGHVFASGPGGIFIFNSKGALLGKIALKEAAANVALSNDEKTLFVTNDMYLLRIKMRD